MELQKSDVIESASSQVWHWEVTGSPILWIYGRLEGDILTQKGILGSGQQGVCFSFCRCTGQANLFTAKSVLF